MNTSANVSQRSERRRRKLFMMMHHLLTMHQIVYYYILDEWDMAKRYLRQTTLRTTSSFANRIRMNELVYKNDETCIAQLRMDRSCFQSLCSILESVGGLQPTHSMLVDEQVAIFLHILAHHVKNRVIKFNFRRSGETVSRHFRGVLDAVLCLNTQVLAKPVPVMADCNDRRSKHFQGCLGAIDGTHIRVRVLEADKSRYRNRKGEISQNVLAACTFDERFIYVLAGWEGSASDSRILRDAISREDSLNVPVGNYYLVDAGFANAPGFLAPYRGQRYHLNEWRAGRRPSTPEEYFNYRHSSARNVIERCFG